MKMIANQVLAVVDALTGLDVPAWLDGGWGIDALLGAQHRVHDDLDLVLELADVDRAAEGLAPLGCHIAEDLRPTRVLLRAHDGRQVDLHPVVFDAAGTGWQAGAMPDGGDCPYPADGFTAGQVEGRRVGCLSARLQVAHHSGYPQRTKDREDLSRLADVFAARLPAGYDRADAPRPTPRPAAECPAIG